MKCITAASQRCTCSGYTSCVLCSSSQGTHVAELPPSLAMMCILSGKLKYHLSQELKDDLVFLTILYPYCERRKRVPQEGAGCSAFWPWKRI